MKRNQLPVAAVLAGTVLVLGACGGGDDSDEGGSKPSPSATSAETRLIDFDKTTDGGVAVKKPADVVELKGAPDDFKQFVAGLIDNASQASEGDSDCPVIVSVDKIDTTGYALGGITECGGAALMWAKRDGVWQQIWGGQTTPGCDDMRKFAVPEAIAGDRCWDGEKDVAYTA